MTYDPAPVPPFVARVRALTASDCELARLAPDQSVIAALMEPGLTLEQTVRIALDGYSDRPALG